MPKINIEILEGTSLEHRASVSSAIHAAMSKVLGTPPDHLFHVFREIRMADLFHDEVEGLPRGDRLMFITFYISHRPVEVVEALQYETVRQLGEIAGVLPEEISTLVIETPSGANWWWSAKPLNYASEHADS